MAARLRHWRQHYRETARFVWRRSLLWGGKNTVIGDPVPADIRKDKLKRLWDSGYIELRDHPLRRSPDPHARAEEATEAASPGLETHEPSPRPKTKTKAAPKAKKAAETAEG